MLIQNEFSTYFNLFFHPLSDRISSIFLLANKLCESLKFSGLNLRNSILFLIHTHTHTHTHHTTHTTLKNNNIFRTHKSANSFADGFRICRSGSKIHQWICLPAYARVRQFTNQIPNYSLSFYEAGLFVS